MQCFMSVVRSATRSVRHNGAVKSFLRRPPRSSLVILAGGAALLIAASAAAAPVDVASDRVALVAYQRYLSSLVAGAPAGRIDATQYIATISSTCGGVLAPLAGHAQSPGTEVALTEFGMEIG